MSLFLFSDWLIEFIQWVIFGSLLPVRKTKNALWWKQLIALHSWLSSFMKLYSSVIFIPNLQTISAVSLSFILWVQHWSVQFNLVCLYSRTDFALLWHTFSSSEIGMWESMWLNGLNFPWCIVEQLLKRYFFLSLARNCQVTIRPCVLLPLLRLASHWLLSWRGKLACL